MTRRTVKTVMSLLRALVVNAWRRLCCLFGRHRWLDLTTEHPLTPWHLTRLVCMERQCVDCGALQWTAPYGLVWLPGEHPIHKHIVEYHPEETA